MFSSFTKLLLKGTLVFLLVVALSALALHIWFVNNARGVMKQIVKEKSHGKFRLELSQLSFDFLSNTLQVRHADLSSTDSSKEAVTYHVKFNRLTLHVGSFWPLLIEKNLILDSIILQDPQIEVRQWRKDTSGLFASQELSVPQEMGRMYHSMLDVLETFSIRRIKINNAKLTLSNKMKPGALPVTISNIFLNLVKTPNQSVKESNVADNSQSIDLRIREQNIALPGGRHKLAFKNFHLQLFRQRIEMDSCTITAITTDSASSSYKIFFKKLMLTGVDFDAMYRRNLIKADSVYCVNPSFEINIDRQKTAIKTKERPDVEKIVRELTGDLDLAFVGVKDAGIRINISGAKKRSLYNSNRDDFQMYGLKINTDSAMPVAVDRFEMLVRDYHLYNQDSSATYSFDSIHFVNNKIRLSNFSAVTGSDESRVHNKRDFKINLFELSGLDWYELVFNETLKAREAYLYNPVIKYTKRKFSLPGTKRNLFSSLQTLDDFMTLDKITVINGILDMKLSERASFNLEKVNFSLYSNQLLKSIDKEGVRDAVEYFLFSKGIVRLGEVTARLENVKYSSEHFLRAGHLNLTTANESVTADAHDVFLDNVAVDEEEFSILINGLRWNNANLQLHAFGSTSSSPGNKKTSITVKNISANNTDLSLTNGDLKVNGFVRSFTLTDFNSNETVKLNGFHMEGDRLRASNKNDSLSAVSFNITDQERSSLTQVRGNLMKLQDSLSFTAARVGFIPDVNSLFSKQVEVKQVQIADPVINIVSRKNAQQPTSAKKAGIVLLVDQLKMENPVIWINQYRNDFASSIHAPFSPGSEISSSGIRLDSLGFRIDAFSFHTQNLNVDSRTGDKLAVENGKVDLQLTNFQLASGDGKPQWQGLLNQFHISNPQQLTFGKKTNAFTLKEVSFGNVHFSSDYLSNADLMIQKNLSAWLHSATGVYADSVNTYRWYNAAFKQGRLSIDSFDYHPTPGREVLLSQLNHQKDYVTFHSGPLVLTGFKPERYRLDSSIIADSMFVTEPLITVYRDKLPPFAGGTIKPLPVDMIRNINRPVFINTVIMKDGHLTYTEKNGKSRAEGTITLTQMQVFLEKLKNRDIHADDSLAITMNALLMDSAMISLGIKESYTDSLKGFLMTLKMKPTSLLFLNPVLTPLSNIKIISGNIDSVQLTAVGREHLAFGKMNMYYRNLRIQLVKDGNPDKTSLNSKLMSFLANTFIIKRNNNGRTGLVYFERLRDRSFFNYIIKMTFSGMATSIGVKKNRKYLKQYKRALKARQLPEFE